MSAMNTQTPDVPDKREPVSPVEQLEQDASVLAIAAAGFLRAIEVGAVVFVGLLVCPPLAVLTFVVVVPLLVVALVLGLLFAVLSAPYLLVHHIRDTHGGHGSLLAYRLRQAGRALMDLAPHRIVADVRKAAAGR